MPRGPNGQRRPADVIGNAVKVMRIATGEEEETGSQPLQVKTRQAGLKGGPARAATLSPEQRSEIARVASAARWKKGGD